MPRSARAALLFLLLVLAAGGAFVAFLDDDTPGVRPARAGAGGVDGTSPAADGADAAAPRGSRNRAGRPLVLTPQEKGRVDAVARIAAQVAAARAGNAAAANIRAMRLPGEPRLDANWPIVNLYFDRHAAAPPSTASLAARPQAEREAFTRKRRMEALFEPKIDITAPARKGLRADYYDFLEGGLEDVPDLASLPPSFTRIDREIDFETDASFDLPFAPETFATLWRGTLVVETAGEYEFTVGSDDGVRVRIDDSPVIEYTQLRPYAETVGSVTLEPGRHKLEVGFYENYVFASCRLFWKVPGTTERAIVPAAAFEPPDDLAAIEPPVLRFVEPPAGMIGDEVTLAGRGFSASPALNLVTFAGVAAEIVSASEDELVVKVPIGASTGSVVVQVGPISTRPRPFEVENLLGLYAEYYLIGTELTDYPDFDRLAPYFVRLDGPVVFPEDDLWDLPYEPDVFAARWFGYLYVPADDEYELTLGSDDGAQLTIDGEVFVDLPGLHPWQTAENRASFTAGFHRIEMRFFENYGGALMGLFWKRRGDAERTPIGRGFLFAPEEIAARGEPMVTSLEPATAVSGDEIVVHGAGFGASPEFVRVEFPGNVWVRPAHVADDRLTVRVPHGAGSGDLRVHAGIKTSGARQFQLGEPMGLRGDYYDLGADAIDPAQLPTLLAARSVTATRTDARFRFATLESWATPVAARPFAVHWSGAITVETAQSLHFAIQSESGALLRVGGADVLSDLAPHTLREAYGGVRVTPGEHAIDLWTIHPGGTGRLHVFVTQYGRADHLELPPSWLRPRPPR